MLLLLSALLFLLIIISYFFSRRDIISPTFLLSFSFFVVVFIAYMFEKELGGDIHGHTVAVILVGILAFNIGEILVRQYFRGRKRVAFRDRQRILIRDKYIFLMCVFIVVTLYFSYKHFMSISSLFGVDDPVLAYGAVRSYYVDVSNQKMDNIVAKNVGLILLENISYTLIFYSLYVYCYNRFFKGVVKGKLLLPFLIGCTIYLFQSGGRSAYLQIATCVASIVFMMIKQTEVVRCEKIKGLVPYLYRVVKYILLVIFLFLGLGYVRSGEEEMDLVSVVCSYTGSSIIGLDLFLTEYLSRPLGMMTENSWCEYTFRTLYDFLNRFGFNISLDSYHDEFFRYPVGTSNIYSGFKYMIEDFSLYGMFFVMFLLGIVYTLFWMCMKYGYLNVYNPLNYWFLSVFFHALVMMPLMYSLPGNIMISTGLILRVFFLYVLRYLCQGR